MRPSATCCNAATMAPLRHIVTVALLLLEAAFALNLGVERGDLYEACTPDGDPDGSLVQWRILCGWAIPMVLLAYIAGAWTARSTRT